ncbi:MAG: hypothetical protein KatS3mg004_0396 [Bryobacteraceae bacterium]|nr:MAG: hypothetical protein KatS3mg004_0396 [Bryobacteraceae bacterium]
MSNVLRNLLFRMTLYSVLAAPLMGQGDTSAVTGVVLGPDGQSVAAAEITMRSKATGRVWRTLSSEAGLFWIPSLPAGNYELNVAKEGFRSWRDADLALLPGQDLYRQIRLDLASLDTAISVTGSVSLLEREAGSGSRGAAYTSAEVNEMPILATNVGRNYRVLAYQTPGVGYSRTGHAPFTVNGNRPIGAVNTMVDSAEYNDVYSGNLLGRGLTEQPVSMEAVEAMQLQTSNFKAEYGRATGAVVNLVTKRGTNEWHGMVYTFFQNDIFNARNPLLADRAPLRVLLPGLNAGGPLKKDRLFLFANVEAGVRNAYRASSTITTLTAAERARAVPAVQPLLKYYPEPNIAGTNLHSAAIPSPTTTPTGLLRLDYSLTPSQQLSGRISFVRNNGMLRERLWGGDAASLNRSGSAVLQWDSTLGAHAYNQARWTYSQFFSGVEPLHPSLGDPAVNGQVGLLIVTGLPLLGQFRHRTKTVIHTYTAGDDFSLLQGSHQYKFGFIARQIRAQTELDRNFNGTLVFPSIQAFLAGQPLTYTRAIGASRLDQTGTELAVYWQDDWRLLPNLGLNLGVRYEYFSVPGERLNRIGRLFDPDRNNLAPRVGFSWLPGNSQRMTVRGGYGVFYAPLQLGFVGQARFAPPLVTALSRFRPQMPDLLSGAAIGTDRYVVDRMIRNPYVQNWNLTVDRAVFNSDTVFSVAYVGNRGVRLPATSRPNGGENLIAEQRPIRDLGVISYLHNAAASTYHSLQVSIRGGTVQSRLQFRLAYTLSKSLDSASDSDFVPVDESNWRLDRGPSDFHQPHLLTALARCRLPRIGPRIVGNGWLLTSALVARSGTPYSILANTNNPTGTLNNRILDVPGALVRRSSGSVRLQLAPGVTPALLQPPAGTVGTLGRNTELAPNYLEWNAALRQDWRLRESAGVQFILETFNLLNRINYDAPVNNVANSAFGRVLTAGDGRQFQFSLRLYF